MRSMKQMIALALMPLAVTGCVSTSVLAAKSDCSSLVPTEWRDGVDNAPAPQRSDDDLALLKEWIGFGIAQTGNLKAANQRTDEAVGIIERCEARDREAIEDSKPKFLGLL